MSNLFEQVERRSQEARRAARKGGAADASLERLWLIFDPATEYGPVPILFHASCERVETESLFICRIDRIEVRGRVLRRIELTAMFEVTVEADFSSGHYLRNYKASARTRTATTTRSA